MKKKWDLLPKIWQYRKSKFFLRMKISMILLLVGVMHLSASTFSQTRVSLNMKDATVQEIFSKLFIPMDNHTSLREGEGHIYTNGIQWDQTLCIPLKNPQESNSPKGQCKNPV